MKMVERRWSEESGWMRVVVDSWVVIEGYTDWENTDPAPYAKSRLSNPMTRRFCHLSKICVDEMSLLM